MAWSGLVTGSVSKPSARCEHIGLATAYEEKKRKCAMVIECPSCHLGQGHSVPYAALGRDRLPWCKRSTGPVPYMPHFRHGHKQALSHLNHLNQIHFEFDVNVDDVSLKSVRVASTLPGPHDYRSVWWLSRLLIMWELVACAKSVRNVTSRRSHIHMSERCIGSPVLYEATVQPARGTYL